LQGKKAEKASLKKSGTGLAFFTGCNQSNFSQIEQQIYKNKLKSKRWKNKLLKKRNCFQ